MNQAQVAIYNYIKNYIARTNMPEELGLDPDDVRQETFLQIAKRLQKGAPFYPLSQAYFDLALENIMIDIAQKEKNINKNAPACPKKQIQKVSVVVIVQNTTIISAIFWSFYGSILHHTRRIQENAVTPARHQRPFLCRLC